MKKNHPNRKFAALFSLLIAAALVLGACQPATPAPTQDVAALQTQAAQTVVAELTANAPPATAAPTQPPAPTAAPATPPPPGPTPDPSVPVAVVPTAAPGEPSAIADYNTTIYSGPGEDYVVYGAFLGSQTALVTGKSEDGQWWAISVPPAPSGNGWVSAGWVTVANADNVEVLPAPPVPPTTEMVPPGPDDPQATALVNAYVRTGPGSNYPAYGIATAGASGRVVGKSEDGQWWVVRLNPENVGAGYGWVEAKFTQASNTEDVQTIATPKPAVSAPPPPPPSGAPVAIAVEAVNVRSGPGTNYPVLVVAPAGAAGEVSGKSADGAWWQVVISTDYTPTGSGWVSASYVITRNTESVPVVEAPPAPPTVGPTPPPAGASACQVVAQDPVDGTALAPGTSFSTTWVLQNAGSTGWDQGEFDIRYAGAASNVPLHQGSDVYDLTTSVQPGWTYNFSVPMIAPFDPGLYGELWQVVQGSQAVCDFYVYIQVQ
jgi:uncharacterized protein YraI